MPEKRDTARRYAPLWSILFAAAATLGKRYGTEYILKREARFRWTDVLVALGGAVAGYATFRLRFGSRSGAWYKR